MPDTTRKAKARDLTPDVRNANKGTQRGLALLDDSLRKYGAGRSILVDKNGKVIAGNKTLERAVDVGIDDVLIVPSDGKQLVAVQRTDIDIDTPVGRELAIADNRVGQVDLEWDAKALAKLAAEGVKIEEWWNEGELAALLASSSAEGDSADMDDGLIEGDVPDALWPTDNDWDVPVLDLALQANAVDLPVNGWGALGRSAKMNGTYHFYTDDYRFEGLWRDPSGIINAGCVNVVEPNFSTNLQMPRALVLFHAYRKRWMARYWQSFGVRIFVDLDVMPQFAEINLLGVPQGWGAYACYMRQSDHKLEDLDMFLSIAHKRAGDKPVLMLVIGGEKPVQDMCKARPECVWVASFEQKFYRNYRQRTVQSGR